jgi:hypothetical protein
MAPGSAPWQVESASGNQDFKYQYHPGGDKSKAPKDAPSALNTVIIPAVNLPKVCVYKIQGEQLLIDVAPPREVQQVGQGWILAIWTEYETAWSGSIDQYE